MIRDRSLGGLLAGGTLLVIAMLCNLSFGDRTVAISEIALALTSFQPDQLDHVVLIYQRLPRALIALYAGAMMAVSGAVLQGLTRNPLSAPTTLGVNAGATLFVVLTAQFWPLAVAAQGVAALAGGVFGAGLAVLVARATGITQAPRGLSLVLAGTLVAMLLSGITNATLLSNTELRSDLLGWVAGNINHVYIDRLAAFWWIGLASFAGLMALSRPLTLILLGTDKAASVGVNVAQTTRLALLMSITSAASAVAICGPVGFIGLVVPHIARPLVGNSVGRLLPASAMIGGALCLLADLCARVLFQPYTLHTGVVMDLSGGLFFILIVRRFYLRRSSRQIA